MRSLNLKVFGIMHVRSLLILLLCLMTSPFGFSQGIKTILIEGEAAIDGNGVFGNQFNGPAFQKVVINEAGQAAFTGRMKETSGGFLDVQGLFMYEPESEEVIQIARMGQKAPGTVGNFMGFGGGSIQTTPFLALNDSGQIAMFATTTGDPGFPNLTGAGPYLFSKDEIINIAMLDGPDPRGVGTWNLFSFIGLANNGQMSFTGRVEIDPNNIPVGLFITDASDNSVKTVMMVGDTIPGGPDIITSLDYRGVNNLGQLVVLGDDDDGDDEEQDKQDIWTANKDGFERLVNDDDPVPGGVGVFDRMYFADINDKNEIVFEGRLRESADGTAIGSGLFLIDEEGIHLIGQNGVDSTAGPVLAAFGTPRLNNNGQIAFQAAAENFRGVYLASKTGGKMLVNTGDPAPGGGTFGFQSASANPQMWLNDAGQVLFKTGIGAFVVDADRNINAVVRIGQTLEGSTVTEIDIVGAGSIQDAGLGHGNQRPMNNSGQVVFWAELEDGRDGIFLWSGPPPPIPDPEIQSVGTDGNDVVVSLDTGVGATYQLRRRDNLAAGDWANEGNAVDGTGEVVELRHANALPVDKHFYDVLVTSPDS